MRVFPSQCFSLSALISRLRFKFEFEYFWFRRKLFHMKTMNRNKLYSTAAIFAVSVGICLILVSVMQQFQLMSMLKTFQWHQQQHAKNLHSTHMFSSTTVSNIPDDAAMSDDDEPLPGRYNLLDDSLLHSNALSRPTKECTLGNNTLVSTLLIPL